MTDVPDEPEVAAAAAAAYEAAGLLSVPSSSHVLWSRGFDYASFRPTPDWSLIRDEVWVDEGADCD